MNLSLGEVEALSKKAARGCGYTWGLAEEAGKAARWLCSHSVDGTAALAALLTEMDGVAFSDHAPVSDVHWQARGGALCPILTGAAFSDYADSLLTDELNLGQTAHPILLVPFAAYAAASLKTSLAICVSDRRFLTDGQRLSVVGEPHIVSPSTVTIRADVALGPAQAVSTRAQLDPDSHDILLDFAHRTYAPATDASRLKGAGAGLTDND